MSDTPTSPPDQERHYPGVRRLRLPRKQWYAYRTAGDGTGRQVSLGYYETFEEAVAARLKSDAEVHEAKAAAAKAALRELETKEPA